MDLTNAGAAVFVPDGADIAEAVSRTTHMAVGAHQDDIPIMAIHGILHCFGTADDWFTGVTVTDGAGSPRSGPYADLSDAEMRTVRNAEERHAAVLGEYSAVALLDYASSAVKDGNDDRVTSDLVTLIELAQPRVMYTHDLADTHDTHVAVALRTIAAIRRLPSRLRPDTLYGCEVWRGLDWTTPDDRIALDVGERPELAAAILAVYDSQISGGKRYDLAVAGRRRANATFAHSHAIDTTTAVTYALDLTLLVADDDLDPSAYAAGLIDRARGEIIDRIGRMSGGNR